MGHLTPRTQSEAYGNDRQAFLDDVVLADWKDLDWQSGPVSDYEISWGTYIEVLDGEVPTFLTERELAGEWSNGVILIVQMHEDGSYVIAGQGMDQEPQPNSGVVP